MSALIYSRYYYEIPFQVIFKVIEFSVKSDGTVKAHIQINTLKK